MLENIQHFLSTHEPSEFERKESAWTEIAEVRLLTGKIVVCDPSLYPAGLRATLQNGEYQAVVRLLGYSGSFYASRLRLLKSNTSPVCNDQR